MTISYSTIGGEVTVSPSGTIPAGELNNDVALVGSVDFAAASGEVTAGEQTTVTSPNDADATFGADSELARQARLAFANGAGTVYGVPIDTTQATETVSSAASGTLTEAPVVDPRVTQATVTVTDTTTSTEQAVTLTSASPPSSPDEADTVRLNPVTGEWAADSSSDYEFVVETPNASGAIATAVDLAVRAVGVCTEAAGIITTLQSELSDAASNIRFSRGVVGAMPGIESDAVSSYKPTTDDQRVVEVAPARGEGADGAVRTIGAITGQIAAQPINVEGSITFDDVSGLTSLATTYRPSTAQSFDRVTAITDEMLIAEGLTTSSESAFADIYKTEIIDLIVEQLYERLRDYRGGSNARDAQRLFRGRIKRTLSAQSAPTAQPPLLATGDGTTPYSVRVQTGATDAEAEATIGIEVASIAKTVNLNLDVGPIRFNGASV